MADSQFVTRENYNVGGHMTPGRQGTKIDRICIHHNAAVQDVIPGVWQNRQASAHYQVTPDYITQCVSEANTAWHSGNWNMNLRSIGIEHLDATGAPNWTIAPETIERSAHLVADICKRRGIPCDRQHILKHSEVSATSCPGGLDIDKLVNRARELLGQGAIPAMPSTPAGNSQPASSDNRIYFDYRGNVRELPTTASRIMRTYDAGAKMDYAGYVHGQTVNGSDKWLKTALHGWYVHESVTGGVFGLKDLGSVNTGNASQPTSQGVRIAQNGTFKANVNLNIRRAPSLSGAVAGTFTAGATQRYDSYIDADGIRWVSWIGASGNRNYVARRRLDNSEIFGVCY